MLRLPDGLAVWHGKTRRSGVVFDVANLVNDAVILPQAFIFSMRGELRQASIESLARSDSLSFMIDTLNAVPIKVGQLAQNTANA